MELGNLMFNTNKNQNYECPKYVVALLQEIENQLCRVQHNIGNTNFQSPFDNTAESFKNDTFEVQAYSWDDETSQEYNFKYYIDEEKSEDKAIKISWYKYLGRDTTINNNYDYAVIIDMFNKCIDSILKEERNIY